MRAALLALGLLLAAGPAVAAPKPRPPAGPLRATIYKMPAPLRANAPAWVGSLGKLAFLGNQNAGGAVDVYLWDPKLRQMGRATDGPGIRHSLTAATDGRLAYVEHGAAAVAPPPGCSAGSDRIVVYDFAKGTKKPVFEGGTVMPDTLCWAQDGQRIAFLTYSEAGEPALALLESGKPLAVTKLPVNYQLEGMVGWMDTREVMAKAMAPNGARVLLRVGAGGLNVLPPGDGPKLSPDGRYLLTRLAAGFNVGVALRGTASGGRTLHRTAGGYGWGPGNKPFLAVGDDIEALDLNGQVQKVYPGAAAGGVDDIVVSPDSRFAALLASHVLTVLAL
jgi:Tol biopolymer transport system component